MPGQRGWQFWVDRGGTFTDVVARAPDGRLLVRKLLSEDPGRYADPATQAIRELLGLASGASLPPGAVESVKMGTTVGTNALLERKGEPTLFAVTAGFRDLLLIGYQNRPDIFALRIVRPAALYDRVIEIRERITAAGEIVLPLDLEDAKAGLESARREGIRSVAVCLLHGYRYPEHEARVAQLARETGFDQISVSHRVSPLMRAVSRAETTVVDAYLSPVLGRYVARVRSELEVSGAAGPRLFFMQSNGGLADADRFHGKDSILSGPAGGIVGAAAVCRLAGFRRVITFDMGGTSTDVAHYDGEYERTFETEVAGVRIRAPMMRIHTVAAGGGSILSFDGSRYRVGPESAGANPGPAAYRRGGPLTVTDCNVMLGRLRPEHFPKLFGPGGDQPLDSAAVRERFEDLARRIESSTGCARKPEEVAEGFLAVAVENMAAAIKKVSVERGYDVTRYTLCCFGGAGGQHACPVADSLGIRQVFLHPLAGVLSAYGMGLADQRVLREAAVETVLEDGLAGQLESVLAALEEGARGELARQGVASDEIDAFLRVHVRYEGTDNPLPVNFGSPAQIATRFADAHRRRFGFSIERRRLVVEACAVEAVGGGARADELDAPTAANAEPQPLEVARVYWSGEYRDTSVYRRSDLGPGTALPGPAILVEPTSTIAVEVGWSLEVTRRGDVILTRTEPRTRPAALGTAADPVMLEIFNKRFMSVAEQMGETLRNTSQSVNIKERLDFSCAVFDREGRLVANAPHIPVHLGSMTDCVRSLLASTGKRMKPGDAYLHNSPYHGGTHLPDLTVVTPAFDGSGKQVLFFAASRAHHADVGGATPGSIPPASTTIREEGVLAEGLRIVRKGRLLEPGLRAWLASGKYPVRNPDQNVADIGAQIAANEKGVQELARMAEEFSLPAVWAYMDHIRANAAEMVRRVAEVLSDGEFECGLDDGSRIHVRISIDRPARKARIDFTGTSPQQPTNFNAPAAVCRAAVLYVFRTLIQRDIPLNSGCFEALEIVIPEGSMLNPRYPAAVVAGNVETSQHAADCLYGALGVLAGSQGTMNNFTFGDETLQYYETVCGGGGAGKDFDGASAVHTHMTNTRITDPEVLEWRFPVLLEEFSIRVGSGGDGLHRGGDGVIRRIRFLKAMKAAILSSRRAVPPFGLAGGEPGSMGRNRVVRATGEVEELSGRAEVEMAPGDVFVLETPGGGGYGQPTGLRGCESTPGPSQTLERRAAREGSPRK